MDQEQLKALIGTVKEMREQQKAYFRTRHVYHLQSSKMLEREVDRLIAEYERNGK